MDGQGRRQEEAEAQGHRRASSAPLRKYGGIVLLVLGLLYGIYSPFRNWVNDRYTSGKDKVMSVIHPQFDPVTVGPGHDVQRDDATRSRTTRQRWRRTALRTPTGSARRRAMTFRPELDVTLTEKVDLAKIIVSMVPSDNFQAHHRPKTLLFIFENGTVRGEPERHAGTADHDDSQRQGSPAVQDRGHERLRVIDGTDMGLTEIEFFKKK